MRNIIDSHLDLGWNAMSWKRDLTLPLNELNRIDGMKTDKNFRGRATVSLPEMRKGRIAVGFSTLMARVPYADPAGIHDVTLDFPNHDMAYAFAQSQLAYYRRLEARGELRIIRSSSDLKVHWQAWNGTDANGEEPPTEPIGAVIAMEGSDGIVEPDQAEAWFEDGLRCASLVHYGCSAYAAGTGQEGPVTVAGRELLQQFERLGVILDTTHLCDTSFFQALEHFGGIAIASHQNCRALVPHQRQFSDEQLKMLIERDGVIGAALDAWMLSPGYERGTTTRDVVNIEELADHIDHVCQLAGNVRHTAIGSDLDGGFGTEQCPSGLDRISDIQSLDEILSSRGYPTEDIDAVFHGNWLRILKQALPAT